MKSKIPLIGVPTLLVSGMCLGQEPREDDPQLIQRAEPDAEIAAVERQPTGDFVTRMEPGQIRSDILEGSNLLDADGENIGDIDALVIDAQSGQIQAVLVQVGGIAGIGERTVAVSWDQLDISRTEEEGGVFASRYEVRTGLSQEQLEDAPEFEGPDDDQVFDDL